MDKVLLTGAVATTGGCSIVQGRSVQEMLLYVIVLLIACLTWNIGYAAWRCWKKKKLLEKVDARRVARSC